MPAKSKIESDKILVKDIFSRMWFRVPEYQSPTWGQDEVSELLSDLTYAMTEKPESEYFLGSLVFQSKAADPKQGQQFQENDLLDGQQRMTTLCCSLQSSETSRRTSRQRRNVRSTFFRKPVSTAIYQNELGSSLPFARKFSNSLRIMLKTDKGTPTRNLSRHCSTRVRICR